MAYYYIEDGDIREDIILNKGDYIYVSSGGTARRIRVNSGGSLFIVVGGTATQIVENGGSVELTYGDDYYGHVYEYELGASVTFLANTFSDLTLSDWATVHSGTTAIRTTLNENAGLNIYSGGLTKSTTVNSGGWFNVYSGGTATNTTINAGGGLWVDSGGTATNIQWTPCEGDVRIKNGAYATFAPQLSGVYFGASGQLWSHAKAMTSKYVRFLEYDDDYCSAITQSMCVMSGGTANGTVVSGGSMEVWSGGVAKNTILYANRDDEYAMGYGYVDILNGGTASNTTVNGGGVTVSSGGKATKVTINSGGWLDVYGGKADGIILNAGGECEVGENGTATILQWTPCEGELDIYRKGKIIFSSKYSGVYIGAGDTLLSHAKKSVTSKELECEDTMHVMSGGTADKTVLRGGEMTIWNGGKANDTIISCYSDEDGEYTRYGWMDVYSGGIANYTFIASAADMDVFEGGKAVGTTIKGGRLWIESGGFASDTTINYYQNDDSYYDDDLEWHRENSLTVSSGGVAIGTTVGDGGYLFVSSGGIATDITIKNGGSLRVASGAMIGSITNLGGTLDIDDGAILNYVYKGGGKTPATPAPLRVSEDADEGWNNQLYDTKTKEPNDEVTDLDPAPITSVPWEIQVDTNDIAYQDKHNNEYSNFVGYGDDADFTKICLENAAKLSLTVTATDAAKVTIWKLSEVWKKGILSYSLKALQATKLTLNKLTEVYSVNTKALLLEADEYYISVESTNAAKGGAAYYNVEVYQNQSTIFDRGYTGDDWADMKWNGDDSGYYGDAGTIDDGTESVIEDGWVGYGDAVDFARIYLDEAARLSFLLDATDATKFTIYKLVEKTDKYGVILSYSLKAMQSTVLKKPKGSDQYAATTKGILLGSGDYYIAMESTNAKKGGDANYNVLINRKETAFFSDADNGWNNQLYDKKTKDLNEDIEFSDPVELSPYTESIVLERDHESVGHEDEDGMFWDNYVGYGDEIDYAKVHLVCDAKLSFTITATDAAKFAIYSVTENVDRKGVVSYSLKTILSASLKKAKGDTLYRYSVTMRAPEDTYYVSMQSTNAAKGGCAYYNIEINQKKSSFDDYYAGALQAPDESDAADTLTMPETGGVAQNELFAGMDSVQDASLSAVGVSLDAASEKLFEESTGGLLA